MLSVEIQFYRTVLEGLQTPSKQLFEGAVNMLEYLPEEEPNKAMVSEYSNLLTISCVLHDLSPALCCSIGSLIARKQ